MIFRQLRQGSFIRCRIRYLISCVHLPLARFFLFLGPKGPQQGSSCKSPLHQKGQYTRCRAGTEWQKWERDWSKLKTTILLREKMKSHVRNSWEWLGSTQEALESFGLRKLKCSLNFALILCTRWKTLSLTIVQDKSIDCGVDTGIYCCTVSLPFHQPRFSYLVALAVLPNILWRFSVTQGFGPQCNYCLTLFPVLDDVGNICLVPQKLHCFTSDGQQTSF